MGDLITESQHAWLRTRRADGVSLRQLAECAVRLYPESHRAPGGHVLTAPGWFLDTPVPLDAVHLTWTGEPHPPHDIGRQDHVLPLQDNGIRYRSYSHAVRDLVRPRLLADLPNYRLLDVAPRERGLSLRFGATTFFPSFDRQQAVAHELKAAVLATGAPRWPDLPLRQRIDPFTLPTHVLLGGINTLTVRRGARGDHRFVLHARDGAKVADGGGYYHVAPAGEFQPVAEFSLWRNIMREFAEEFLGYPEEHTGAEPFTSFERARAAGRFQVWHYGVIVEPLELGGAQMTVAVLDDSTFDTLFAGLVDTNDEGDLRTGLPLHPDTVARLDPHLSASARTLLDLLWRDRHLLLDD